MAEQEGVLKELLIQYSAALSRVKKLRQIVMCLESRIAEMDKCGFYVADVVTCGKKRKKSLGKVTVTGFPHEEYQRIKLLYEKRKSNLMQEEQELLELITKVEERISKISDIEMRDLLTLYYIEDLNWVQVALRMNKFAKGKKYTESSCRQKHDRYLEKNF